MGHVYRRRLVDTWPYHWYRLNQGCVHPHTCLHRSRNGWMDGHTPLHNALGSPRFVHRYARPQTHTLTDVPCHTATRAAECLCTFISVKLHTQWFQRRGMGWSFPDALPPLAFSVGHCDHPSVPVKLSLPVLAPMWGPLFMAHFLSCAGPSCFIAMAGWEVYAA